MGVSESGETEEKRKMKELKMRILCNMSVVSYEDEKSEKGLWFLAEAEKIKKNARVSYLMSLNLEKSERCEEALSQIREAIRRGEMERVSEDVMRRYRVREQELQRRVAEQRRVEKRVYGKMLNGKLYWDKIAKK